MIASSIWTPQWFHLFSVSFQDLPTNLGFSYIPALSRNTAQSSSRCHDRILPAYEIHRHWHLCQGEMKPLCKSWQDPLWAWERVQVTEARTRRRLRGVPRRVHLKPLRSALRMKAEKVTAARQLLVSPVDRAWPQGLADALVLELAQNPTHDWLFSHKANSQTRGLSTTLLAIVGPPRVRRVHFCPPPQVCHPHSEPTAPNVLIHVHYVRASHAERLAKNFSH